MQDGIWEEESNIVVLSWVWAGHNKTAGMGSRSRDLLFSRRRGDCAHADVDIFYVILVISGQITSILARSFSHKLSPMIFEVMTTFSHFSFWLRGESEAEAAEVRVSEEDEARAGGGGEDRNQPRPRQPGAQEECERQVIICLNKLY